MLATLAVGSQNPIGLRNPQSDPVDTAMSHPSIRLIDDDDLETISLCLYVEDDAVFAMGERINEQCEDAYMNGYNWEALILFWLKDKHPDLADGLETDPEAGMFAADYAKSDANRVKAKKFYDALAALVSDEEALTAYILEHSEAIPWD
ncbi:MAG: Imm51 family immunity protein [Planctomycetota bacterium]